MHENGSHGPWTIDLKACTVTHHDGWQFHLWPSVEEPSAYGCACVLVPPSVMGNARKVKRQMALTYEAGLAFLDALTDTEQDA